MPARARILALALIAVLLLDPFAPLAAGFWLSFVAVGVILAAASADRPASGRWRMRSRVSCACSSPSCWRSRR